MNHEALRKLARSTDEQLLYKRAKEMNINLFHNKEEFTNAQVWLLYYLELYSSLYEDIALEKDFIDMKVLDSWNRTEAYLYWKSKNRDKKPEKPKNTGGLPSMKFKGKK